MKFNSRPCGQSTGAQILGFHLTGSANMAKFFCLLCLSFVICKVGMTENWPWGIVAGAESV